MSAVKEILSSSTKKAKAKDVPLGSGAAGKAKSALMSAEERRQEAIRKAGG